MKFIADNEICLNQSNDLLHSSNYVKTLKEIILNHPVDLHSSFTIGLFGEWGSGKSSIIKTLENEFKEEKHAKIKFIVYDAWKYSNDSFRRMLLLKIQEDLKHDKTKLMNSFYLNESEEVNISKKINWNLLFAILILTALAIIVVAFSNISTDAKIALTIINSIISVGLASLKNVLGELRVKVDKPHLFAPEQFEECFKEMVDKSLQTHSFVDKAFKWIQGEKYLKGIDKLVIVIDNIDRCQKELAFELLTNIKNFLGNNKNIVFLIPVDDEALKRHIEKINNDKCETEANEFLRKFFNITIQLKKLKTYDVYNFAKKINDTHQLGFSIPTIDIMGKEYASNPRRIIQLYNNLIAEMNNYDKEFSAEHETIICKMVIIKEEWPIYHKELCRNPYLLNEPNEQINEIIKINPRLRSFLQLTKRITQDVDLQILNRILLNDDDFSGLPLTLLEAFDELNEDEIFNFTNADSQKHELVLDYLIEKIDNLSKNLRYNSILNYLKIVVILNNKNSLASSFNLRLSNQIAYSLPNILGDGCDVYNSHLVKYSRDLSDQNINYLKEYIFGRVTSEYASNENESYSSIKDSTKDIFRAILSIFKDNNLAKFKNSFFIEYSNNKKSLNDYSIDFTCIKYLVSEQFYSWIIEHISVINSEDISLNDFLIIKNNASVASKYIEQVFQKINLIHTNYTNLDTQAIIIVLSKANELLNGQKKLSTDQLEIFYKLINKRTVNGVVQKLSQEIVQHPEFIDEYCLFLYNIYNCTANNVSTVTEFSELYSSAESRKSAIKTIVRLKDDFNYSLSPLHEIILNDEEYDENSLELLEYVLKHIDAKKNYSVPVDKLETKLNSLLEISIKENGNGILSSFLEDMTKEVRIKETLINLISKRSKNEIISLPTKLQILVFDFLCSEKKLLDEYADQLELLRAIASNGTQKHITELVKVVVQKINHDDVVTSLELIDLVADFAASDQEILTSHLKRFKDSDNKKFVKRAIKKINNERQKSIFETVEEPEEQEDGNLPKED